MTDLPVDDQPLSESQANETTTIAPAGPREKTKTVSARRSFVATAWHGPLPPPAIVAQYNDIIPNGADRVMAMAELSLRASVEERRRGPLLGASVSALAMLCALASIPLGAPWELSAAFISVPVLATAKALIDSGRRGSKKD